MSSANQNDVDALLAQVQAQTDAVKANADAGTAAPGSDPAASGTAALGCDPAASAAASDQAAALAAGNQATVLAALDQAAAAVAEIAGEMEPPSAAPHPASALPDAATFTPPDALAAATRGAGDIRALLAIEVPVIVQLGVRRLTVGEVMRLAVGAIVEFGKSAEEELDLLVNNKPIGKGHAVKVGENFGIKVTSIGSVKETIRKLGS